MKVDTWGYEIISNKHLVGKCVINGREMEKGMPAHMYTPTHARECIYTHRQKPTYTHAQLRLATFRRLNTHAQQQQHTVMKTHVHTHDTYGVSHPVVSAIISYNTSHTTVSVIMKYKQTHIAPMIPLHLLIPFASTTLCKTCVALFTSILRLYIRFV